MVRRRSCCCSKCGPQSETEKSLHAKEVQLLNSSLRLQWKRESQFCLSDGQSSERSA